MQAPASKTKTPRSARRRANPDGLARAPATDSAMQLIASIAQDIAEEQAKLERQYANMVAMATSSTKTASPMDRIVGGSTPFKSVLTPNRQTALLSEFDSIMMEDMVISDQSATDLAAHNSVIHAEKRPLSRTPKDFTRNFQQERAALARQQDLVKALVLKLKHTVTHSATSAETSSVQSVFALSQHFNLQVGNSAPSHSGSPLLGTPKISLPFKPKPSVAENTHHSPQLSVVTSTIHLEDIGKLRSALAQTDEKARLALEALTESREQLSAEKAASAAAAEEHRLSRIENEMNIEAARQNWQQQQGMLQAELAATVQLDLSVLMERDAVSTARIAELEVALSRAASDSELVATLRCELEASQAASGEFQQRCDALSSSLREMGTEMQRAAAASASELEVLGFKLWDTESLLEATSASCTEAEAARDLSQAQLTAAALKESEAQELAQQGIARLQKEISLLMERDAVSTARIAELEVALSCAGSDPEQQEKLLQQEIELQEQREEQQQLMEQLESMADTIAHLESDNNALVQENASINSLSSDTLHELQTVRGLNEHLQLDRDEVASEQTSAFEEQGHRLEELVHALAAAESERAQLMQHLHLSHQENTKQQQQLQHKQQALLALEATAAASHSNEQKELARVRQELLEMTQKEAHSSRLAIQAQQDAEMLQFEFSSLMEREAACKARIVELESVRDPQFDSFRMQVSDIFQRHVIGAYSPEARHQSDAKTIDCAYSRHPSTAVAEVSELSVLRSRLASSEVSHATLTSQLAESDAFVHCVKQSVLQLEKEVAKLKQKLKISVNSESAAVARARECEGREKDAVARAQAMANKLATLQAEHERELDAHHARAHRSVESECRVAALESGMQALMDEGKRALDCALAVAMREGSARAILADEVQLLRRVSQQSASPCISIDSSSLSVLSSSVPALLRRRILFARHMLCKAAACRTQLFSCQHELSSLASTWRLNVAAMQRETASAVLAAVAAAQSSSLL